MRRDPPDRFELVFIALYDREGVELGFYEVGGQVPCPRTGRPQLMSFSGFIERIRACYVVRNERDFHFQGEDPTRVEPNDENDEDTGEE